MPINKPTIEEHMKHMLRLCLGNSPWIESCSYSVPVPIYVCTQQQLLCSSPHLCLHTAAATLFQSPSMFAHSSSYSVPVPIYVCTQQQLLCSSPHLCLHTAAATLFQSPSMFAHSSSYSVPVPIYVCTQQQLLCSSPHLCLHTAAATLFQSPSMFANSSSSSSHMMILPSVGVQSSLCHWTWWNFPTLLMKRLSWKKI